MARNICNNRGNTDFKSTINKRTYYLKTPKKIWTEVTTRKTKTKKLYNELIQKYIDTLIQWKEKKVIGLKNTIS